jgi:flavodoxin
MKILVLHYSRFGNTEALARAMVDVLHREHPTQLMPIKNFNTFELLGVDILVLGTPTHRRKTPEMVRHRLDALPERALENVGVAVFDTRYKKQTWLTGSAARKLVRRLEQSRGTLLVPPVSFFVKAREGPLVEGELDRARAWAATLLTSKPAKQV